MGCRRIASYYRDDYTRYSKTADNALPKEFLDGSAGYTSQWFGLNPFREIINGYDQEDIVTTARALEKGLMMSVLHCSIGQDDMIGTMRLVC